MDVVCVRARGEWYVWCTVHMGSLVFAVRFTLVKSHKLNVQTDYAIMVFGRLLLPTV